MPDTITTEPLKITEVGVYDVPEETYHADKFLPAPSLSSSGARKILNECPAKFWFERENPREPSDVLRIGKAAHQKLLEPGAWSDKFEVLPANWNARTNAGKEFKARIIADGKTPLTNDQFLMIEAMLEGLKGHPYAMAAFEHGVAEKTLIWKDPEFGIWCRVRPDFFPHNHRIVADYKTTRSAAPDALQRAMFEYGYHQQADWYLTGIRELGLIESPRFLFIFQEKDPPYLVTPVTPSDIALDWARIQNRKARETFARCLDAGKWPGYTDDILTLDLPVWAEHRLHERKEQGAFEIAREAYAPHAAKQEGEQP